MSDNQIEKHKEIYESKMFLNVRIKNNQNPLNDILIPKSTYDRIMDLYGKERIVPLSFITFANPNEVTETIRCTTHNVNFRTSTQITNLLDLLNNYCAVPASFYNLDELEKLKNYQN